MTLPRLQAITKYQKQFPPVHVLVAAYMGAGRYREGSGSGGIEQSKNSGLDENGESLFDLFPRTPGT
jgi:hypothetical protein